MIPENTGCNFRPRLQLVYGLQIIVGRDGITPLKMCRMTLRQAQDKQPHHDIELHLIPHTREEFPHFLLQDRLLFGRIGFAEAADPSLEKVQALLPFAFFWTIFIGHFPDLGLVCP